MAKDPENPETTETIPTDVPATETPSTPPTIEVPQDSVVDPASETVPVQEEEVVQKNEDGEVLTNSPHREPLEDKEYGEPDTKANYENKNGVGNEWPR